MILIGKKIEVNSRPIVVYTLTVCRIRIFVEQVIQQTRMRRIIGFGNLFVLGITHLKFVVVAAEAEICVHREFFAERVSPEKARYCIAPTVIRLIVLGIVSQERTPTLSKLTRLVCLPAVSRCGITNILTQI